MVQVRSSDELLEQIGKMNRENSVCQVFIPGKGKFAIVLQEEDSESIAAEVQSDHELRQMIHDSREAYIMGNTMTTSELVKSMSPKDFAK